jgi:RNA polymerase sigma-70 factor (ECF subfamily)
MTGHLPDVSTLAAEVPAQGPARIMEQGVTWSFSAVYDAHFPFVWRSVRRLGVVDSAVDDLVQEVFVVVHRQLSGFRGDSSIRSWLFAITSRLVRDSKRALHRKPGHLGGRGRVYEDVELHADAAPSQHDTVAATEAVRTLHSILDAMPEKWREVFILAELEQMTIGDIAQALQVNPNTVYSRLRAARADFERAVLRVRANERWRMRW